MLSHPAVVAGDRRSDAQSEALLAEQSVTTVTGAVRDDLAGLGEVADVLLLVVAGPSDILLTGLERSADGVQAGHEVAVAVTLRVAAALSLLLQTLENLLAHDGHDAHVGHNVSGVGDLNTDLGKGGVKRAHAERNHVHGTALHAAIEELVEDGLHLGRSLPVVGGAGVLLLLGADERALLHTGNIGRSGTSQEAVGALLGIQTNVGALLNQHVTKLGVLFLGTVAPVDGIGFAELADLLHPLSSLLVSSTSDFHGARSLARFLPTCNSKFFLFASRANDFVSGAAAGFARRFCPGYAAAFTKSLGSAGLSREPRRTHPHNKLAHAAAA